MNKDKFEVEDYAGKSVASYMIYGNDFDYHKQIYEHTLAERVSGVQRDYVRMQFFEFDSSKIVIVRVGFRDWKTLVPVDRQLFYRHHVVTLFELRGLLYAPIRIEE